MSWTSDWSRMGESIPAHAGEPHVEYGYFGSIPAHAGEPAWAPYRAPAMTVYPRPRGGTGWHLGSNRELARVYPRPRGGTLCPWPFTTVYPRPRGGTAEGTLRRPEQYMGLSPPTRGNQGDILSGLHLVSDSPVYPRPRGGTRELREHLARIIIGVYPRPRGGTSLNWSVLLIIAPVYPRPRGGTGGCERGTSMAILGLSPPTRGNLCDTTRSTKHPGNAGRRSIPAHAGEPSLTCCQQWTCTGSIPAHAGEPDSCQGGLSPPTPYRPSWGCYGLSPPTRGNLSTTWASRNRVYPRPRGGTSTELAVRRRSSGVYPRPRGGTRGSLRAQSPCADAGLSPPTRGNQWLVYDGLVHRRSIPAHAGEPNRPASVHTAFADGGLSPPTRGNLCSADLRRRVWRSIPAHAGEPPSELAQAVEGPIGLSPPTRGNHGATGPVDTCGRSIPAHAGEPYPNIRPDAPIGVYPRPRGGTLSRQ